MAPPAPLRTMMALCAPVALVAFVANPGAVFRSPMASSSVQRATSIAPSQRASSSAAGPLFAKPLEYEVSTELAANSSVILNLDIPGKSTQMCYDKAIRSLSKEAGQKIPGFSGKNVKHPVDIIERFFGIQDCKGKALEELSDAIVTEAVKGLDLKAIGNAELVQNADVVLKLFNPGSPMLLKVKCDIWPEVKLIDEYVGFELEVEEPQLDETRVNAAWKSLLERNVILEDTEEGYAAKLGDSVFSNMEPFRENEDGSRGDKLPNVASGDGVEIVLEPGRYMPGLADGMEGVKAGETREIRITFPDKLGPDGGDLEGTKAIFEVEAVEIKTRKIPEVNEEFAESIRKGLTLESLKEEVEKAVMEEAGTSKRDAKHSALELALLGTVDIPIPETLIIEQAREKFALMMTEFKSQGESDEKIQGMITKENFVKYVEVVRKSTTRGLVLSLIFTHIAGREGLEIDPVEITDQLDLIRAQSKGKDIDEARAKDKIEAQLERDQVLDWVSERTTFSWVPAKPVEEVIKISDILPTSPSP